MTDTSRGDKPHHRLRRARQTAGYASASAFARKNDVSNVTYRSHENGTRGMDLATMRFYAKLLDVDWRWIADGGGSGPPELTSLADRAGRLPIRLLGFERNPPSPAARRLLVLLVSAARARGVLDERMNVIELDFCIDLVSRPGDSREQALSRAREVLAELTVALCQIAVRNREEEPLVVPILTGWRLATEDGRILWRWAAELCDYGTLLELAGRAQSRSERRRRRTAGAPARR